MFLAAFTSRSWQVPHSWQVHSRAARGLEPSLAPHALHTCDVGSNLPIFDAVSRADRAASLMYGSPRDQNTHAG